MTATGSSAKLLLRTQQECVEPTMAAPRNAHASGKPRPTSGQKPDGRSDSHAEDACCPAHAADASTLAGLPDVAREVYALLRDQRGALSAYALIESLSARLAATRIYPQTVYRALATLVERNLVHRLESANSYRACSTPGTPHDGIHFLCTQCGGVEEAVDGDIDALLTRHAAQHQFAIGNRMIEVRGVCARCTG